MGEGVSFSATVIKTHCIMYNDIQVVIMAGGVGSRFWPMSIPRLPKAVYRCDGSRPFPHSIDSR